MIGMLVSINAFFSEEELYVKGRLLPNLVAVLPGKA
jgi:hypothetical protein